MSDSVLEQDLPDQTPVFFLHIPKTAGLSLAAILENCLGRPEIAPFYDLAQLGRIPQATLLKHNYFRGHIHYEVMRTVLPKKPVCLTLLRQPVERFLSAFAQVQRHPEISLRSLADIAAIRQMSLADFVNQPHLVERSGNINCQTDLMAARFNFIAPEEFYDPLTAKPTVDARRVDLEFGKRLLNEFAFVGLTERFQESLWLLAFTFGWRPVRDFQTLNVSPPRPWGGQITADLREKIEDWNTLDLELYHAAEQVFEARFTQMTQTLLERYGTRSQAQRTSPLPAEELYGLLEKHYERRYAQRHPLIPALKFKFDQALPGSGWHSIQTLPEYGAVRWTGPGTQTTLDLPLATDKDLNIQFCILMSLAPDILESLRLTVNEQPVPLTCQATPRGGGHLFHGCLPQTALKQSPSFTRLVFEVNRTLRPKMVDPHNADERLLGVLFNWIEIFPAP